MRVCVCGMLRETRKHSAAHLNIIKMDLFCMCWCVYVNAGVFAGLVNLTAFCTLLEGLLEVSYKALDWCVCMRALLRY